MPRLRAISKRKVGASIVVGLLLTGIVVGYGIGYDRLIRKFESMRYSVNTDRSHGETIFPEIDTSSLSETQKHIVALTKQEFLAQSPGTKFSEGQKEAWCSDFVSWTMKESGTPLSNPNSGSWRIPGTYTLLDYYKDTGKFQSPDSGYTPKTGDVAIYNQSPIFGDHTNFVLRNDNGVLTTVGGNENGRIRIYKNDKKQYQGLIGYGILK